MMLFIICRPLPSSSFAVLAHEAIIDALWKPSLEPLLKKKYPGATEEELKKAHAFAYGGSIISDIGYYPLGSHEFSNLVHYVRSGDFVSALLEESQNVNEYAFALGVLCHYEADTYGHSLATNEAVAKLFPHLKEKYGKEVTFEEGKNQHARVEFGFDVLQTARGNYESNAYHDFIGFEVSDSVLERAFFKTYGIRLKSIFKSFPAAIAVFRFSVKTIIPELTRDAWKTKKSFITQANPLATEENYHYKMSKNNYRKEFTTPKVQSTLIEIVIGVLPKAGPLARFKPMIPSPECENLFLQSFDSILVHYAGTMKKLKSKDVSYANKDLDTGKETEMGEYKLADKAYYKLLKQIKRNKFADVDEGLKKNLDAFYGNRMASPVYGTNSRKGKKITLALEQLNTVQEFSGNQ
jgi:hypothetical protein